MKRGIILAALLTFPAMAMACVDTSTGSFCSQYKDITQRSWDNELSLTRIYNSAQKDAGWFGYGWGTPFETRLILMPDGSAVVQEPGNRKVDRYAAEGHDGLHLGVATIVAAAIARENLDPEAAEALRKRLLSNEEFRRAAVLKYGVATQLSVGAKLHSSECAKAVVIRNDEEYRRTSCGEGIDYFDLAGRLIRREDKDYRIAIHYAGDRPDRIEDSLGQKIYLKWTETGHVAEARTDKDTPVITYRYDEKDNLVFSNDAAGNDVHYEYDADHKLTKIAYADQTHMDMQYGEKGLIASVTDTDGAKISYTYRYDPVNPAVHYWTTATSTDAAGKQRVREAEYVLSLDAAGVEKLARVTKREGHEDEEIVLDENERAKRVENSNGTYSEFTYDPASGKATVIVTNEGRREFSYDKAGNLSEAKNDRGLAFKLNYDSLNRIIRMVETNQAEHVRRVTAFRYNAHNKPVEIKLAGKGEIRVTYDPNGEISKVKSIPGGASTALRVMESFQGLQGMVKVPPVNLCL